jgi:hypothetical protein
MSMVAMMAKKKTAKPAPQAPSARKVVLQMKGTDAWKDWLDGLGKHLRTPTSTIVDHALVKYAKEVGYGREAPER